MEQPVIADTTPAPAILVWLRHDLRTDDHPALSAAAREARSRQLPLLAIAMGPASDTPPTPWGFARCGAWPRAVRAQALLDLRERLKLRGVGLLIADALPVSPDQWRQAFQLTPVALHLHGHPAPEEQEDEDRLSRSLPPQVCLSRHPDAGPMFDDARLPGRPGALPRVFTDFRRALEATPLRRDVKLTPPWPAPGIASDRHAIDDPRQLTAWTAIAADARQRPAEETSWPWHQQAFQGGATAGLRHLETYLASPATPRYKQTRNGLSGTDFSSKWSMWLAQGALSGRQVLQALNAHERQAGASEGSGWLWFEMLWREHFHGLMHDHGRRLFLHPGLSRLPRPPHDPASFRRWCEGETAHPLVNAGMRELARTGWLSNRMRQIVASYLIHDLACDWRAGAAWFEHHLIDFDVCSNQGNWLYIAGRGTDPRGGRRFNPDKQAAEHDPEGRYQRLWKA